MPVPSGRARSRSLPKKPSQTAETTRDGKAWRSRSVVLGVLDGNAGGQRRASLGQHSGLTHDSGTGLALSFTRWVLVSHGSTYWTAVCVLYNVSHLVHCLFVTNIRNMAVVWTGTLC